MRDMLGREWVLDAPCRLREPATGRAFPISADLSNTECVALINAKILGDVAADYLARLEAWFDEVAARKRYTSRYTCALRACLPGAFQAEGLTFGTWMDACNAYAYDALAQVAAGERKIPEWDDFKRELPAPPFV